MRLLVKNHQQPLKRSLTRYVFSCPCQLVSKL